MSDVDYRQIYRGVNASKCSAWQMILPTGERHILLFSVDATMRTVVEVLQRDYHEFAVQRIDVGQFVISSVHDSYSGDSRWVDQDWIVTLNPKGLELAEKGIVNRSPSLLNKPAPRPPVKRNVEHGSN